MPLKKSTGNWSRGFSGSKGECQQDKYQYGVLLCAMISEYLDAIGHLIVKISTAEILKKNWKVDILGVDILGS